MPIERPCTVFFVIRLPVTRTSFRCSFPLGSRSIPEPAPPGSLTVRVKMESWMIIVVTLVTEMPAGGCGRRRPGRG